MFLRLYLLLFLRNINYFLKSKYAYLIESQCIIQGLETDRGFGQCKSLVRLNVKYSRVTVDGARLAMEYLPKLQIFDCHDTLHVAAQMFTYGRDSPQLPGTRIPQLPLMNLRCDRDFFHEKGDLAAAIEICPSVVFVNCYALANTFTDEDLKHLLNLKNLRYLSLAFNENWSFDGGILPILEKFGASILEKLHLQDLQEVNISAIAQHCSNLRSLKLDCIYRYILPSQPLKPVENRLRHLEYLKMTQYDNEENGIPRPPPTARTSWFSSLAQHWWLSTFTFSIACPARWWRKRLACMASQTCKNCT